MNAYRIDTLDIILDKCGAEEFIKVSYPVRYGRYSEISAPDYLFQFNLNGEIAYIQGRGTQWPHPSEWLKRTLSNDWVYYSTGGYEGVYSLMGEYYLPCLPYPSNPLLRSYGFDSGVFETAMAALENLRQRITGILHNGVLPGRVGDFFNSIVRNGPGVLDTKSQRLHQITRGRISVLPPDARHSDYTVIPVVVADGCLYHCGFCRVKSPHPFSVRSQEDILEQIQHLKALLDRDVKNYNALFLGQHDALNADPQLFLWAARKAYEVFGFGKSFIKGTVLYLFGSVTSFLGCEEKVFSELHKLPYHIYINIGLESVDPDTLRALKKPVSAGGVKAAFNKMVDINRRYENIEVTANFVIGDRLPRIHDTLLHGLLRDGLERPSSKGAIYLSPLDTVSDTREVVKRFFEIKTISRLPVFTYLIQRL